jgi:hypothetical protein
VLLSSEVASHLIQIGLLDAFGSVPGGDQALVLGVEYSMRLSGFARDDDVGSQPSELGSVDSAGQEMSRRTRTGSVLDPVSPECASSAMD